MLLRDRLAEEPTDANALTALAELAVEDRRIEEATVLLRRAADADPAPERRVALINHLQKHSFAALALRELEQLPALVRSRFEVGAVEAKTLNQLGMHREQIAVYERMLREKPDKPGIWMNLANALKTVGRIDDAVRALKKATKLKPTLGQAYWTLANFKSYRFTPADIAQMHQALRAKLDIEEALHIHFALGKAYEDRSDYEASFRHYSAGNALRTKQLDPDQVSITELVDDVLEQTTPKLFERLGGSGCPRRTRSSCSDCTVRARPSSSRSLPAIPKSKAPPS